MTRVSRNLLVAAALFGTSAAACGSTTAVTVDDMTALQGRIDELERANGRARVQIGQMEDQIFLLQDRVDAYRIAMQRTQDPSQLRDVVTIGVGSRRDPVARTATPYQSMPTASAPPPHPDIDPLAGLPVQRIGPAGGPPQPTPSATAPIAVQPNPADDEIVITMETLEARYGDEPTWGADRPAQSARGARSAVTTAPVAQPPVDVGNRRLPVVEGGATSVRDLEAVATATPYQPQGQGAGAAPVSPLATYRTALDEFNNGEYARALQSLEIFLTSGPEADYMDNTLFWMGECYYGLGQYDAALGFFQRVVSEYPDGNKVPDSLLKVALTYERLDNAPSAIEVLTVLSQTYPNTDAAGRAAERLRSLQ